MNKNAVRVIERLGGTAEVARLFRVRMASVSDWKRKGIPTARMMYLQAVHPDALKGISAKSATAPTINRQPL